jgi:hypothetical protein
MPTTKKKAISEPLSEPPQDFDVLKLAFFDDPPRSAAQRIYNIVRGGIKPSHLPTSGLFGCHLNNGMVLDANCS